MKHLGDITKICGHKTPVVDVVIGGSPCQDLSIAGKRAGLSGVRSGLYMEQIRIIKEMREADVLRGRSDVDVRPRYMVWENVPGAFSTNGGKDFAAVLEEAIRVAEPEAPDVPVPEKGWPTSGCFMGDKWSVAWRVLDAQFWGVPQRRRRIALIADFGGKSAPEILFVRKSVSGNIEPGKPKGKEVTGNAGEGSGGAVTYGIGSYHSNAWKSDNPNSGVYEANIAKTLDALNCGYPGCNQGGMAVVEAISLEPGIAAREGGHIYEGASGTLRANAGDNQMSVAYSIEHHPQDSRCNINESGKVQTLTSRIGTGGGNVPMVLEPKTYQQVTGPLMANSHPGSYTGQDAYNDMLIVNQEPICINERQYALTCTEGTAKTLTGTDYKGVQLVAIPKNTQVRYIVRRLTPLECERLQGFPDGWTDIGEWVDSNGKKHKEADSPRYKALGNSIAIPPWKWVLKRLCACYERDATMASLFDGIGGFPLIWEQLNGKGSCLWASEIEEFPMAVTKIRFDGMEDL